MQIRKLTVKDRKRLSFLIKKLTEVSGDKSLLTLISSTKANNNTESEDDNGTMLLGINLLRLLLDTLEVETQEWFSELIGVTVDKFYELPIDTEAIIIKQIVEAEESNSFFTIVSELYSKIQTFQNKFSSKKNK
jgi:hypothetical protein